MWAEAAGTLATPLYIGVVTLAFSVAVVLVMYLSAEHTPPPGYETRRSIVLLEAMRHEGAKLHERETAAMAPSMRRSLENTPQAQPEPRRFYGGPSPAVGTLWPKDHRGDWAGRALPVAMGVSGSLAINALMLASAFS